MENQELKGTDVITVYAAVAVVALATMLLIKSAAHSMGGSEAQRQMAQISRQILSDGLSSLDPDLNKDKTRAPASAENPLKEGRIGKDPWGQPFLYHLFEVSPGSRAVAIWSFGPNGERDSSESDVLLTQNGRPIRILPRGDDIGHLEIGL